MNTNNTPKVKRGFADVPEGQIHYRWAGNGQPLLLLHEATGSSALYIEIIPLLATKFMVIAMDTFGHGESDPPPADFDIEDAARTVVNFLDALEIDQTHILAHWTGSGIAVEVGALYPSRVDRLVLAGCPDFDEGTRERLREAKHPDRKPKLDGSHLLAWWQNRRRHATPLTSVEMMHRAAMAGLQSLESWQKVHRWIEDQYMEEKLPRIQSPTLFITGEHDITRGRLIAGVDLQERHRSLLPKSTPSETASISDAGGFATMEKPSEYARQVSDFLEKAL